MITDTDTAPTQTLTLTILTLMLTEHVKVSTHAVRFPAVQVVTILLYQLVFIFAVYRKIHNNSLLRFIINVIILQYNNTTIIVT